MFLRSSTEEEEGDEEKRIDDDARNDHRSIDRFAGLFVR